MQLESCSDKNVTEALPVKLFHAIEERALRYCHWKSVCRVTSIAELDSEVDILVALEDRSAFEQILFTHDLKEVTASVFLSSPFLTHYYGLDEEKGDFFHLHVYYSLVTGGELVKNYHLPIESKVLSASELNGGVRKLNPSGDLLLLLIRKSAEFRNIFERLYVRRHIKAIRQEIAALQIEMSDNYQAFLRYLGEWFPGVREEPLRNFARMMTNGASLDECHSAAVKINDEFRRYRLRNTLADQFLALSRFIFRVVNRSCKGRFQRGRLKKRGVVVAIVGGDASGKSTVTSTVFDLYQRYFQTRLVHSGKPPRTILTTIPSLLMKLVRKPFNTYRTTTIQYTSEVTKGSAFKNYVLALRGILVAYERYRLLKKVKRQAQSQNTIIISDRYPCAVPEATDGPLCPETLQRSGGLIGMLARLESFIYSKIPAADLVLKLHLPVDEAIERNRIRNRQDKNSDDLIRFRHRQIEKATYPESKTIEIDARDGIESVVKSVADVIWRNI